MSYWLANYSKGQLKIQQMAFVLMAMMVFFGMVALFVLNVSFSGLKENVQDLRANEAQALVQKMSATPEFSWTITDCAYCIDEDKVLLLKNRTSYDGFWNLAFLQIEKIYPEEKGECTKDNYPDCGTITIVDTKEAMRTEEAFVALCRYEPVDQYTRCELGKIHAGFKTVQ